MITVGTMSGLAYDRASRERLKRAFELMTARSFDEAETVFNQGLAEAQSGGGEEACALFYSAYGVLYKLKKDFILAWRYYEKAEKLLPEDPSLKLISARLLIDVFGQYDAALSRCRKACGRAHGDATLLHQIEMTMGLAYLRKGGKALAVSVLQKALRDGFVGFESAGAIDLRLIEALLKKKVAEPECRNYLQKALAFAETSKEEKQIELFKRLLSALDEQFPPAEPAKT